MAEPVERKFGKSGYKAVAKPDMTAYLVEFWTMSNRVALILSESEYDQLVEDLEEVRNVRRVRPDSN